MEARYRTVSEPCLLDMLLLGGWAFELEGGRGADALANTLASLESLIALGLPYGRSERGQRLYDPVEVLNFMKWAGLQGLDRFWLDRYVETGRSLVRNWLSRSDGLSFPDSHGDARFQVTLQRTFDIRAVPPGTKLRLRMPVPLSTAYVREIEILPLVAPELRAEVTVSDGRLEARVGARGDPLLAIGAQVSFIATPRPADMLTRQDRLEPAEADLYLRPVDGLVRVTPRIQRLADSLANDNHEPWSSVRSFWNYMLDELVSGMVHYDQIGQHAPGDYVLESGWYDCQLGSALFVSLCRANGIPARIISGHLLYRLAPTNHYWAEAWIEGRGWLPFDFLCWDLSAGGRDLKWRDYFAGVIDYRMVTQCLPKSFTGSIGVRLPAAWHMLQVRSGEAIEISLVGLDGRLAYRDRVTVHSGRRAAD